MQPHTPVVEVQPPSQRPASAIAATLLCGVIAMTSWSSEAVGSSCAVVTDGEVSMDIVTVTITPSFQLNGNPFPTSPENAARVSLVKDGLFQASLGDTDQPLLPVHLVAGTYDLLYQHKSGLLVPQNEQAIFATNVPVTSDGQLVVNIPSVNQAGHFMLNGVPFPASDFEDANVFGVGVVDGNEVHLGNTRDGQYSLTMLPGEYDIVYRRESGGVTVPINSNAAVDRRMILANDLSADVSVQAVAVSGSFLFNGSLAPDTPFENGRISLHGSPGDVVILGDTRDQSYTAQIIPGAYDVHYDMLVSNGIAPRNQDKRFLTGVQMSGGSLDIDVPAKNVVGDFTRNGMPPPATPFENARISFVDRQTLAVNEIGVTADQSYSTRLIPGSYDVLYEKIVATDDMPVNDSVVLERVSIPPGGLIQVEIDIDVPRTFIEIDSTLDGAPWPGSGLHSGELVLFNLDESQSAILGATHDLPISAPVVSGTYRFGYSHSDGTQVPLNPLARLPQSAGVFGTGAAFQVPFWSIVVQPELTLNGDPWPLEADQSGRLFFGSGDDLIELSPTWQPGQTRALQGIYDLYYAHSEGDLVPVNFLTSLSCFRATECIFCDRFE